MSIGILVEVLYNTNMGKKKSYIEKSSAGRPSIYSDTIVAILDDAFRFGATVEQACAMAKIDKATYYRWLDSKPDFATRMEYSRNYLYTMAKDLVRKSIVIDKDVNTAKWLLEKTEFKQIQQNNTQVNINNPIPIMGGETSNVSKNNNIQENIETPKEN